MQCRELCLTPLGLRHPQDQECIQDLEIRKDGGVDESIAIH
jgi:hypothetical protein